MQECWKPIPNFEGFYEVSDLGNFRSLPRAFTKGKNLKMKVMRDDYLFVRLSMNGKQFFLNAHRIIAKVFIPNPENKEQVNHKNSVRGDNRVDNLEWVTPKENIQHAVRSGRLLGRARGINARTTFIATCHPPRKAVGKLNQCKACYMKDWHIIRKKTNISSLDFYNREV